MSSKVPFSISIHYWCFRTGRSGTLQSCQFGGEQIFLRLLLEVSCFPLHFLKWQIQVTPALFFFLDGDRWWELASVTGVIGYQLSTNWFLPSCWCKSRSIINSNVPWGAASLKSEWSSIHFSFGWLCAAS